MQVGKYQLIHKLATGGMAEVYLARSAGPLGFEKLLVLKRILPHLATEQMFVEMFLTEARLAAQLNHPNIVQIFDFGEAQGTYFLAMEYIDGPNLREVIKRASEVSLALPVALCARIISAACEGLSFAHNFWDPVSGQPMNIIHRDISPDNILLSRQGAVKVVDFGIAKAAGVSPHTQTGVLKGKLAYMPPEQLRNEPLDRRTDVYALGVVFYELLTGQKPFVATSEAGTVQAILFETHVPVAQRRADVPDAVQRIVGRALAKERERRYPDCASFQADLEEFILSTAKPMGATQIAQIVSMMTAGAESPLSRPEVVSSLRSSAQQFLSQPSSPPEPVAASRPYALRDSTEERTSAARPSKLIHREERRSPEPVVPRAEPPSAPPVPNSRRHRERGAAWGALAGSALLLAGGGYLSWRSGKVDPPVAVVTDNHSRDGGPPEDSKLEVLAPDAGTEAPDGGVLKPPPPPPPPPPPKGQGILELRVEPEAMMYLNGWQMGRTRSEPFPLDPGRYTLKLVNAQLGKEVKRQITVTAGQTTRVEINLLEE